MPNIIEITDFAAPEWTSMPDSGSAAVKRQIRNREFLLQKVAGH